MKTRRQEEKEFYSEGEHYPKNKIIDIVETFGFFVDLDKWDEKDKGWMRIENNRFTDAKCVIIHKHHLEIEVHREKEYLQRLFQNKLLEIGEEEFKKKFNDLMKLK